MIPLLILAAGAAAAVGLSMFALWGRAHQIHCGDL